MNRKIKGKNKRGFSRDNTPPRFFFPHIVFEDKKEVWIYVESGFPTVLAVPILMKRNYPDYKSCLCNKETFLELGGKL